MANDFSNRISARSTGLTTRDRPTPDDIDDLRRRQEEHAKRTQEAPKKSFDSYLVGQGDDASDKESSQPEQEPKEAPQPAAENQSIDPQKVTVSKNETSKGNLVGKPFLPPMAGRGGRIIRG